MSNKWDLRATNESNPTKRDAIYREGLNKIPQSAELMGSYALFLETVRKDNDRAQKFYERAIKANPNDDTALGNYALFLQ